jgi:poly(3-hydroxybutyrate) depolymerase
LADKGNFLVVCPQFLEKDYPTRAYQWGNMFDDANKPIPRDKWTFAAIEHLFDEIKQMTDNNSEKYCIFGHSAGGQFVHRFVLFMPNARYKRAIAANPGWYTMPDYDGHKFPYGLRNSGLSPDDLKKSLSKNFVLMLGENDIDANDPELNKGKLAEEQGATRFDRGQNYFKAAQTTATAFGANMQWLLRPVPKAHHSDREMGVAAAPILFE